MNKHTQPDSPDGSRLVMNCYARGPLLKLKSFRGMECNSEGQRASGIYQCGAMHRERKEM